MRRLDSRNPSIAVRVAPQAAEEDRRFVIIELSEVTNPRREALSFEVRYRPQEGGDISLGTFSPYPADNPGRFIVATQGKVQGPGKIVVSIDGAGPDALGRVSAVISRVTLGPG